MAARLLTLFKKVVFRAAFGGFIVVEFVLFVLLLWAVSEIIPNPNYFLLGILIALILSGPFLIGACSYLVFQRMTRVEYVLSESERWLAERHEADARRIKRRNVLHRWAVWIPAISVMLFCLFLDQTWPPVSHLFHAGSGKLIGYRVSVPLKWTIVLSEPDSGIPLYRSYVWANRWRGMLRGTVGLFLGRTPSISISSMSFYGDRPQDGLPSFRASDREKSVSRRVFTIASEVLTCEEFATQGAQQVDIRCTTQRGSFFCTFNGDRKDSADFYGIVQRIKKTN